MKSGSGGIDRDVKAKQGLFVSSLPKKNTDRQLVRRSKGIDAEMALVYINLGNL